MNTCIGENDPLSSKFQVIVTKGTDCKALNTKATV